MKAIESSKQNLLDKVSIYTSAACAIHCLLTPVIIALIPSFSVFGIEEHTLHVILVGIIVPMSLLAVYFGCQKHNDNRVLIGVGSGLTLLILSAIFGHDLGEIAEKAGTVIASAILIASHWLNFKLCQKHDCQEC